MSKKHQPSKPRNPEARELEGKQYRHKIVPQKKHEKKNHLAQKEMRDQSKGRGE